MSVRAKFKLNSITLTADAASTGHLKTAKLSAVYPGNDPNHENAMFFKWTPYGQIELGTLNPTAAEYFEIGKEYYVDFTLAE